jgi:hypothetical protein
VTISGFDAYRNPDARKLMVEYVMTSRVIDAGKAVAALRELDYVGLAYVHRDAVAALSRASSGEYDPCEVIR